MQRIDSEFGRIDVSTVPVPDGLNDFFGTYTPSGRVLISECTGKTDTADVYRVFTQNGDGTDVQPVFEGEIPRVTGRNGARGNGVRWMCFPDNRRVHLGDWILECETNLDCGGQAKLVPVEYPEVLDTLPGVFCRWSEIIVSPDGTHTAWTMLSGNGAANYLAQLVRGESRYTLADVLRISSGEMAEPDPGRPGFSVLLPVRGGELKQFVRGGKAVSLVGNSDCVTDSVVQALDSGSVEAVTHTAGYEETTIFSPDETLGIVMSPHFSKKTNCSVFGLVPQPCSMAVRSKIINALYMYCVAGVRAFRKGHVGPRLIDISRSEKEGRAYEGVDLSDPEGEWVYYSPMSWAPDSLRVMWNERTRRAAGPEKCRLRTAYLADRKPGAAVPACAVPEKIPYAERGLVPPESLGGAFPIKIAGLASGSAESSVQPGTPTVSRIVYEHFSDDGKTFTDGSLSVESPGGGIMSMGRTVLTADLTVTGEHTGRMDLTAVFEPVRPGVPLPRLAKEQSRGYALYDGERMELADMEA